MYLYYLHNLDAELSTICHIVECTAFQMLIHKIASINFIHFNDWQLFVKCCSLTICNVMIPNQQINFICMASRSIYAMSGGYCIIHIDNCGSTIWFSTSFWNKACHAWKFIDSRFSATNDSNLMVIIYNQLVSIRIVSSQQFNLPVFAYRNHIRERHKSRICTFHPDSVAVIKELTMEMIRFKIDFVRLFIWDSEGLTDYYSFSKRPCYKWTGTITFTIRQIQITVSGYLQTITWTSIRLYILWNASIKNINFNCISIGYLRMA